MKNFPLILMGLLLSAFGGGCSQDSDQEYPLPAETPNRVAVTLNIKVPGAEALSTRALTEADENELKTIDLLVFKQRDGDEYFDYHTTATSIDNNAGSADKTFHATLLKSVGTNRHRIVVVANARGEVNAALAGIDTTANKARALEKITFATGNRWNTKSSDDFSPLPMWGETQKLLSITGSTTSDSLGLVRLMRSVARIDVGLNFSGDRPLGFGDLFRIEDIYVYNANDLSAVAPAAGNLSAAGIAESPTLVGSAQAVTPAIAYTHKPADDGFVREIYVGEALNKGLTNRDDMFCIVVGGYYTAPGSVAPATQKTWYRVDFFKKTQYDEPQEHIDILRNHRYRLNIVSVHGPGYSDPETAFNSLPVNMDTEIIAWEEGSMNDITFDGQYQLTVDKDEVTLYEEGTLNPQLLNVYTDYYDGWTIDTSEYSWIHVTPEAGAAEAKQTLKITADAYTGQTRPREGWFWIQAGKLKKRIFVRQLNESELTIEVTPTTLVFRRTGTRKTVTVTTYPKTQTVYFTKLDGPNPIVWLSGGYPVSGRPNATTYAFQPVQNTTGKLLSTLVTVYVQDTQGKITSKTVTISQMATDLLFQAKTDNPYPAAGGDQQFTVTSDTGWQIANATGDTGILTGGVYDTSLKNAGTDMPYAFSLNPNNSWAKKSVTFTPGSPDPDFLGGNIVVEQAAPVPVLTVSPASTDLGSAATAAKQTIIVTSNAQRRYTTSGSWNGLIASVTPAASTVIGTHTYNTTTTTQVEVTPKTYSAAAGTPAAGGPYTATATFTTINHTGAAAKTRNVTFTRIVPAFFTGARLASTTIPGTGGSFGVKASTNAVWKVVPSLGNPANQTTPSAFAEKTLTVTNIPANPTSVNRTVTFNLTYDTDNKFGATLTATQGPGYHIASVTGAFLVNPLPGPGESVPATLTVTGSYPAFSFGVADSQNTMLCTGVVGASSSGGTGVAYNLPANKSWSRRTLILRYNDPIAKVWKTVGGVTAYQSGYMITAATATPVTAAAGGSSVVAMSGFKPTIPVRVTFSDGASAVVETVPATNTESASSTSLTIPANPGAARIVTVQYYASTWITITSWTQEAGYLKLADGTIYARNRVNGNNWAATMGIDLSYNYTFFRNATSYTPTTRTGCGGYSEGALTSGWRVPNQTQAREIAGLVHENILTSGELTGGTTRYLYCFWVDSNQQSGNFDKVFPGYEWQFGTRCVHD